MCMAAGVRVCVGRVDVNEQGCRKWVGARLDSLEREEVYELMRIKVYLNQKNMDVFTIKKCRIIEMANLSRYYKYIPVTKHHTVSPKYVHSLYIFKQNKKNATKIG